MPVCLPEPFFQSGQNKNTMKKILQRSALVGIASVAIMLMLSSFSLKRGGDSYTISVNGKQVIQYYVYSKEKLPSLTLNANTKDELAVYYRECGKIGTSRKLSIRNDQNKILKEWKFVDSLGEHSAMTVSAKEISGKGSLGLFYTSDEVSTPRKLVSIELSNLSSASR